MSNHRMFAVLAGLFVAACSPMDLRTGPADTPKELGADARAARVSALFAPFDEGVQPGVAVMVVEDGDVVYSRGFGYADLESGRRINAASMFRLASVSKQFTAMAALILAERGVIGLDDTLAEYLPELARYAGVTVRDLIVHTSGLPDYYESEYYDSLDASALPDNEDLVPVLAAMNGPLFAPGERYEYSNSAYEMLALVVERAAGKPFREFMHEAVFAPAGMRTALIHDHTSPEIPKRVYGYDRADGGTYVPNDSDPLNGIVGSGGMYASLEDFHAWDRALHGETLASRAGIEQAFAHAKLAGGERIDYGLGWRLDQLRGHRRVAHNGSWVGFRTGIARYPDERLTIVVLANRSDFEPSHYIDSISDIYLDGRGDYFLPAESMHSVRRHHAAVPTDDIWWTVTGEEMAWMHRHIQQLFPTVPVYRNGPVRELDYERRPDVATFPIETPDGPMPFTSFLDSDHSTALGVVILHEGRVVFEQYPRMREYEKPIYWSTSKVFAGTLVRLLEERGDVDVNEPIETYVPALAESDFAGTTVRNILDMASGLDCQDEYEDRSSCYYQYSIAIGDGFREGDGPDDPYEFLSTLEVSRHAAQGTRFSYSGVNNFILGWLVEEVTGYPFHDVFTKVIWHRIGAEADAAFIAYHSGIPLSHGGFISSMRDLARFGLLYTPSYARVSEQRIISAGHVDLLLNGGRPSLLRNAGVAPPEQSGIRHNVYQWGRVDVDGFIFQGGWGGQGLIVNPELDVVAVFASYFKDDYSEKLLEEAVFDVLRGIFVAAD